METNLYSKVVENITKIIEEKIENDIYNKLKDEFNSQDTYTCTNSINESFTKESFQNLIDKLLPCTIYNSPYLPYLQNNFKFEPEVKEDQFNFLAKYMYGMPVYKPTKTILIKEQIRKHRCKRINKKWAKRYGYREVKKEIPDCGILSSCCL